MNWDIIYIYHEIVIEKLNSDSNRAVSDANAQTTPSWPCSVVTLAFLVAISSHLKDVHEPQQFRITATRGIS